MDPKQTMLQEKAREKSSAHIPVKCGLKSMYIFFDQKKVCMFNLSL